MEYFSSLASASCEEGQSHSGPVLLDWRESETSAAAVTSGSTMLLVSEQQLNDSDGEIYFNVSVRRDKDEQQQQRDGGTAQLSPSQLVVEDTIESGSTLSSSCPVAVAAPVRKRKVAEQPIGAGDATAARMAAGQRDGVKRARLSASTKVSSTAHSRNNSRALLAVSSSARAISGAAATPTTATTSTHRRQPSMAPQPPSAVPLPPSTTSSPLPAATAAAVPCIPFTSSSVSVSSSVAPSSAYAAMMAELDARLANASTANDSTAAARSRSAQPTATAPRAVHTTKASKNATSARNSSSAIALHCAFHSSLPSCSALLVLNLFICPTVPLVCRCAFQL